MKTRVYINIFIIFSILGFLSEFIISLCMHEQKQTLLIGPWMPIYGLGILLVLGIDHILSKKLHGKEKIFFCFLLSFILLTLIEGLGGFLTNFFFQKNFWDYTHIPFSIGMHMNLLISLIWGFGALFLCYFVLPRIKHLLSKIPIWLTLLLSILFLIDNLYCFWKNWTLFSLIICYFL